MLSALSAMILTLHNDVDWCHPALSCNGVAPTPTQLQVSASSQCSVLSSLSLTHARYNRLH